MNGIRLASIAALLALCGGASAQTTVSVSDVTQLRNAIATANGDSNGYIIELTTAGTYTLGGNPLEDAAMQGDLDIFKTAGAVTIRAATGLSVTIDGGGADRVFHINNGVNAPVAIEGITITGGIATDDGSTAGEARGGAILKVGAGGLTLNNVTVSGNAATGTPGTNGTAGAPATSGSVGTAGGNALGGGLYLAAGTVQLNDCVITNNSALAGDGGSGGLGGPESGGVSGHGGDGASGGFAHGGAIYNATGLTVTGGLIQSNTAAGGDGGSGGDGAPASMFPGNGGTPSFGGSSRGAAIFNQTGTLIVTGATLDQNSALGGNGGRGGDGGAGTGIADGRTGQQGANAGSAQGATVYGAGGTITVTACTLSNNTAGGGAGGDGGTGGDAGGIAGNGGAGGLGGNAHGAGVYAQNAMIEVINSTISGNATNGGTGGAGGRGGFGSSDGNGGNGGAGGQSRGTGGYVRGGSLGVDNSTVANNVANDGTGGAAGPAGSGSGGTPGGTDQGVTAGVFEDGTGGNLGAQSSIFADNAASIEPDAGGTLSFNDCIVENGATPSGTGNLTGDPALGPLQNNGGPTLTHAIGAGSLALNAGSNPRSLTTDQRGGGFPRDDGSGVDAGAFEYDPSATTPPPIVTAPTAAIIVNAGTYGIQGTAQTGALVRIYTDLNDDGVVNGADAVVGTMTVSASTFSISVALSQDTDNNFLATAEGTLAESSPVNVPTITEDSTAPAAPVVTDPASATTTAGPSYTIQGTAEPGALVRVYIDFDNSGTVNGADVVVASQQLAPAVSGFSVSTPITQSTTNNFVVTGTDAAGNESPEADVPAITETSPPAISPPVILDPSAPVNVNAANYSISGTAQADSLVRIYSDVNNDGFVNGGDTVVGMQQLTSGATAFSISVSLNQSAQNNFLATAEDGSNNESLPADVPTITDTGTLSGGGGGGGGGCSTGDVPAQGMPLWAAILAGGILLGLARASLTRREKERQQP